MGETGVTNPLTAFAPLRSTPSASRSQLEIGMRLWVYVLIALVLAAIAINWTTLDWVSRLLQLGIFAFGTTLAFRKSTAAEEKRLKLPVWIILSMSLPAWGAAQIVLDRAAYRYVTMLAILDWAIFPASLIIGWLLFQSDHSRGDFLKGLYLVAAAATGLELIQMFVMGRYAVLSSGYPLLSSNLYAEIVELLLPVVLAISLRSGSHLQSGIWLSLLMLCTTIASGARAGTALSILAGLASVVLVRKTPGYRRLTLRKHYLPISCALLLMVGLEGSATLRMKLLEPHPFAGRWDIAESTFEMFKERPLAGFGLGAFPFVYPQFERFEPSGLVNHAHNDYLELAAEGGLVAVFIWVGVTALTLPYAFQTPWAVGTAALTVHSFLDFPLHRLPVIALFGLLLAAAAARRNPESRSAAGNRSNTKYLSSF